MAKLFFVVLFFYYPSWSAEQIDQNLAELQRMTDSTSRMAVDLERAAKPLKKIQQDLKTALKKLEDFNTAKWATAAMERISPMTKADAEKAFQNPSNETEKIMAAEILSTYSKASSQKTPIDQRANDFVEREMIPALVLFLQSLTPQERKQAVSDNPLAFGSEIESFISLKPPDEKCTEQEFRRAFKEFSPSFMLKNIVLFWMPYYIYQTIYLPAYVKRLRDFAKKWQHPKASFVQNIFTARMVQFSYRGYQEALREQQEDHEKQVRLLIGRNLTSNQIQTFERQIVMRSPLCYGDATKPSMKVLKYLRAK